MAMLRVVGLNFADVPRLTACRVITLNIVTTVGGDAKLDIFIVSC